nr:BrnA antitoxin family protein [Segnochrobactrum spirostomi]
MRRTVRYEVDLNALPPLTGEQRAEIDALSRLPDADIDRSDIPALDDAFWKNAVRNPFHKPAQIAATLLLDSDVLDWLEGKGGGTEERINAILRRAMLADRDHRA